MSGNIRVSKGNKRILKYGYTEKTITTDWAKNYQCLMNYLATLNSRQESAAMSIYHFCTWAGVDPNQLLSLKSNYNSLEAEKLLDSLANAKVNFPEKRKWHVAQCVRGFFRTNYRQLQAQAGRSMPYNPRESHTIPSKKMRLKLFKACRNTRDQALVMMGTCTAIAIETLSKLKWSNFEEDWQQQEIPHISITGELLKGHGKGKYKGVRQETFVTPEAKQILLEYRKDVERTFTYRWKDSDNVFISVKGNIGSPLAYRALAKRATVLEKRADVDFTFHDGRRITQTALENAQCPINWIKKIKGRKVSGEEAPYSRPLIEQLRAKYKEALPDLEFLHEDARTLDENKLRSKMMLDFARLQGYGPDKLKRLEDVLARARDVNEAVEEFRKLKDTSEAARAPKIGKHIIAKGEIDLMQKLDEGWSLVQSLSEDKYLLKF